ncbi:MAG TPA: ATP-binding protein, partial [Candidatus Deferrimicrobiaceae bacterium]|nr:ATP-binding protein [Candidatus Deferrimicrobiaceae bacterium]
VAAVVALAIAGYLRVWAKDDAEARAFASLSFLIFLWCFPEYLWKTLDSGFWRRVSLAAVVFIPPFVLRYAGAAVRTRPRWHSTAFVAGIWISAGFSATVLSDRLFFSPWWNVAALLYVYPYLALSLQIVVRYGFRANPSSIERKKFQFLLVGGGIASLVAPLNFLPGTGVSFPPLASFAILLFFYFMATGILHLHFFEFPDIVGRAIILVIQVFAFAVVFGVLEVVSGRKFWFPLAGTFLISFFLLTFYPVLMRKLGGISSDLLVRESRAIQSALGDFAKRIPESVSLAEIAQIVEEALGQVPFVHRASLWIPPEGGTDEGIGSLPVRQDEYLRALGRFSARFPALKFMEHGGSRAADVAIWDDSWDASFPIFLRGKMVGVAMFLWREKTPSFRQLELLIPFLEGIGLAVENIRQKQGIQKKEHFATVGELAAGLAHEVRTPAGVIKGAAQFLSREASPRDREFLDIIVEEADRLNGVVTEFLEYARPGDRSPKKISLRGPVERAVARLGRERENGMNGIRSHVYVGEPVPTVTADPTEIERVVFNLLTNAVEAMPQGGDLTIRIASHGEEGRIVVEDTGTGIGETERRQLFRPFFTTRERGVGMGLAICRRIVEENGGSISFETVPGKGSRFTVRLPGGGVNG